MAQIDREKIGSKQIVAIDVRAEALLEWFKEIAPSLHPTFIDLDDLNFSVVSGDASFRRYFRSRVQGQSYILVDAPPDKEDSRPFVMIAEEFGRQGINVPVVHARDYQLGFMCLSDFGDTLLWEKLDHCQQLNQNVSAAKALYHSAFFQLEKIQRCKIHENFTIPTFDHELLTEEMLLFKEWFCEGLLGLSFSSMQSERMKSGFEFLIESALTQTQVCVHRDYHSRNLLFQEEADLGVIDFQDAVIGPVTYDLVSLLKDCYITWPRQTVNSWALDYARLAQTKGIIKDFDETEFLKSFDLMGIQRHLKAIGIFARLYLRDERLPYLLDIPRTLDYVREVAKEYQELSVFSLLIEEKIVPTVEAKIEAIFAKEGAL